MKVRAQARDASDASIGRDLERYLAGRSTSINRDIFDQVWKDQVKAEQWQEVVNYSVTGVTTPTGWWYHPKLTSSIAGKVLPFGNINIQTSPDVQINNIYPRDIASK